MSNPDCKPGTEASYKNMYGSRKFFAWGGGMETLCHNDKDCKEKGITEKGWDGNIQLKFKKNSYQFIKKFKFTFEFTSLRWAESKSAQEKAGWQSDGKSTAITILSSSVPSIAADSSGVFVLTTEQLARYTCGSSSCKQGNMHRTCRI